MFQLIIHYFTGDEKTIENLFNLIANNKQI
jgi:hypothetical protein